MNINKLKDLIQNSGLSKKNRQTVKLAGFLY
jgi:hypothetical protein